MRDLGLLSALLFVACTAACGSRPAHDPVSDPPFGEPAACWPALSVDGLENLRCWTTWLSSPELDGRQNGSPGGLRAREAIARTMEAAGLQPAGATGWYQSIPDGANVVGLLPGTVHPDEVIVVGAHYDHLGRVGGVLYPGADDNASGVAVMIEAMRALVAAKPRRSVLFVAFDSEEPPEYLSDRMGSRVFVEDPPLPWSRVRAMIALDMVGGDMWAGWESPLLLLGLESFQSPPPIAAGPPFGPRLLHLRTVESLPSGRQAFSDHGPFYDRKIPSLMLTSGRSPHYHQPEDRVDHLNFPKMERAVELLVDVVQGMASNEAPPEWTDRQPLVAADARTVAELLLIATGEGEAPRSPEVPSAVDPILSTAAQDLLHVAKSADSQPLSEAEALSVVQASLLLQCLLASDDEIPPFACLL